MTTSITLTIFGQSYLVNFPNVSQLLDIESMKMALTNGTYGNMVRAAGQGSRTSVQALDMVDTIANFAVLVPELREKLKVGSYTTMPIKTASELIKIYKKSFYPWYSALELELFSVAEEVVGEKSTLSEEKAELEEQDKK